MMDKLETLRPKLEHVMLVDRLRLRRQLDRLHAGVPTADFERRLERFESDLEAAEDRLTQRRQQVPVVRPQNDLPIHEHRETLIELLRQRQVLIVAGETGSGKSTQLPKICLQAGFGIFGLIGHTQPRRIAARTIAARVAEELPVALGHEVGYKIRFNDRTDARTYIKLMTDGILLAETQTDRYLHQYEVIILDEAHERSLNIDFLIGYLKQHRLERPDLRVIVTSATIDAERFSEHFADEQGPAPIVQVSGRTYPVEIRYRPPATSGGDELEGTEAVVHAVHEVAAIDRGDMLVFLPTERDIREMARRLRGEAFVGDGARKTEVLPLYARLSTAEQNRIFEPAGHRRIILATNVAESSLTVPNIRYVIDTGTARISRYSPKSKILRLPIEPISRASADQRAGRCGRVAPGICIRLYDVDDYEQRDQYTTPEIRRTNLAAVILQAKSLQLGEIEQFPFLDAPRPESLRDGYRTLFELRALDHQRQLTPLGRQLARMPVDPRIGRMILAADQEGSLHEVLVIAAALEIQDPRERPYDRQQQADEQHAPFLDAESDFVSYLKLWDFYHHLKATISRNQLRKACQQNFLSYNRLREWTEIHRQLLDVVGQHRMKVGTRRNDYGAIHRALLAGLLSGVAYRTGDREYTGAGGLTFQLWPGSGLVRERPAWIMAAERVETSRRYGRTVARVSPTWVENLADHLVRRSYSDPHWRKKVGTVMAHEKVSLFGLPVVVQRRVRYGPIDPAAARQIFLQAALVDGQVETFDTFQTHNQQLREEIAQLAARTRRRDLLLDDYSIYMFYDERVPADVFDVASMRRWLRASPDHRRRVQLQMEDLVQQPPAARNADLFPNELCIGALSLPVEYNFRAGEADDGVTMNVPLAAVNQLAASQLDWLVPGLLEEKVTALIRSLPKVLRRNFVPVPETAKRMVAELQRSDRSLLETLATQLTRVADERIVAADFDQSKLPPHLQMNIRVWDDAGAVVGMGRDLAELQLARRTTTPDVPTTIVPTVAIDPRWHRDQITDWDFGDLPPEITLQRGTIAVAAYPMLVDQQTAIGIRLADTPLQAEGQTRRAIARLYSLVQRKSLGSQIRWLPRWAETCVWAASLLDTERLKHDTQLRLAELAFLARESLPRDEAAYRRRLSNSGERIAMASQELAPVLPQIFEAYHRARLAVESLAGERFQSARQDMQRQLQALFSDGFLVDVPWSWLQQFPRYLEGVSYRCDKLRSGAQLRDAEAVQAVAGHWGRYQQQWQVARELRPNDPLLAEYRWMIEEYRVSLFAQPLGTVVKVSPQRLEKQWDKIAH